MKVYKEINEVPKDIINIWESLDISIEQKPQWIEACEKLLVSQNRYYFIDYDENNINYIVVSTLVHHLDCLNYISDEELKNEIVNRRKEDENYFYFNVLFISTPMSNFPGIIHNKFSNEQLKNEIIKYCKDMINIDAIFYCGILDYEGSIEDKDKEYDLTFPYYPNTVLDLNFSNFDDYLASLNRKKRWDLKNKQKIFLSKNCRTVLVDNSKMENYLSLYELHHSTESKNDQYVNYTTYDEKDQFKSYALLDDKYKWLIAYNENDKIIGFVLLVVDNDIILFKSVGLDYEYNNTTYTYFNLYHDAIKYAIDNSIRTMYCGTTTYDVKQRLGCKLINRFAAMDIVNKDEFNVDVQRMNFNG